MRCNNCNTEFQDGLQFCPNCGAPASMQSKATVPLRRTSASSPQPPQQPQPPQPQYQQQSQQPFDANSTQPLSGNAPMSEETMADQSQRPYQQPQPPYQQPSQQPYQQHSQQPYQHPYQQPPYQPAKSNGGTKWLVIGLLGVLFIALAGFIAWMLINKNKDNEAKKAELEAIKTETQAVKDSTKVMRERAQENVVHDTVIVVEQTPAPPPPPRRVSSSGKGIWPHTSTRYLDPSELYGMSAWDLKIMRNEIYARHGYIFQTTDMRNYFNSQPWYTPISRNVRLSKVEEYNVQLIKSFE